MKSGIADLRFALRRLARSPGFVLATVLMLGLGIALSVAMYSVVRNVLLAGLPFLQSENVVVVSSANAAQDVGDGQLTPAAAGRCRPDRRRRPVRGGAACMACDAHRPDDIPATRMSSLPLRATA